MLRCTIGGLVIEVVLNYSYSKAKDPQRRNIKIDSLICFSPSKIDGWEGNESNFLILFPNKIKRSLIEI